MNESVVENKGVVSHEKYKKTKKKYILVNLSTNSKLSV